jgi:hypothetical protein
LLPSLQWLSLSIWCRKIWLFGKFRKWALSYIERYFGTVIFSWW